VQRMINRRGQEQRNQTQTVYDAGDNSPRIGSANGQIQHPRKPGDAQDYAGTVTDRVNKLL